MSENLKNLKKNSSILDNAIAVRVATWIPGKNNILIPELNVIDFKLSTGRVIKIVSTGNYTDSDILPVVGADKESLKNIEKGFIYDGKLVKSSQNQYVLVAMERIFDMDYESDALVAVIPDLSYNRSFEIVFPSNVEVITSERIVPEYNITRYILRMPPKTRIKCIVKEDNEAETNMTKNYILDYDGVEFLTGNERDFIIEESIDEVLESLCIRYLISMEYIQDKIKENKKT